MYSSTDIHHAKSTPAPEPHAVRNRLLRLADVKHMTGLGRSTIYAAIRAKSFPAAVNLTAHAVAWRESEIDAWIAARPPAAQPIEPPAPVAAKPAPKATRTRATASTSTKRSRS
ncbi:AlpA family transcriptional regulator [Acidovorax delafieldii]|uniref:helix-turn-helix transcriptional regulator n=1 Tax=Acidovorax delafieldii TaxID=47920 RepID=UPI003ED1044E